MLSQFGQPDEGSWLAVGSMGWFRYADTRSNGFITRYIERRQKHGDFIDLGSDSLCCLPEKHDTTLAMFLVGTVTVRNAAPKCPKKLDVHAGGINRIRTQGYYVVESFM